MNTACFVRVLSFYFVDSIVKFEAFDKFKNFFIFREKKLKNIQTICQKNKKYKNMQKIKKI